MRRQVLWTGAVTGFVLGACTRIVELTVGKAVAFTYAVVVGVVANLVFDFVREPSHIGQEAASGAQTASADPVSTTAALPLPFKVNSTAASAPERQSTEPQLQATAPPDRPGPGSGGLY